MGERGGVEVAAGVGTEKGIELVDLRCSRCGGPRHARDVDPLPGAGAAVAS